MKIKVGDTGKTKSGHDFEVVEQLSFDCFRVKVAGCRGYVEYNRNGLYFIPHGTMCDYNPAIINKRSDHDHLYSGRKRKMNMPMSDILNHSSEVIDHNAEIIPVIVVYNYKISIKSKRIDIRIKRVVYKHSPKDMYDPTRDELRRFKQEIRDYLNRDQVAQQPEEKIMHSSRKVFLLDNEPRCILAVYENNDHKSSSHKYTVDQHDCMEFKTGDRDIKVGDYVVVPTDTRHCMTVNRVVAVDIEPDLESNVEMYWVVCPVDKTGYDSTLEKEDEFLEIARKAEKTRKKKELREKLLEDVPSDTQVLLTGAVGSTGEGDED